MIRILIRPAKRLFTRRQQWTFEVRAATNGERIDPRDTYNNRDDVIGAMRNLIVEHPVELVVYDRYGNVEFRETLRA
jgi:hypothetical protein